MSAGPSRTGPDTPSDPDVFRTLAGRGDAETRIQRSRFLAEAGPAADAESARAFVADLAARHHGCRHVCHAWRLGVGAGLTELRSDGGEPAGTAGEPILAAIRQAGVTDAVVAVARYFGGVKLGTGGLARAYGEAAALALTAAPRREIRLGRRYRLDFPYAHQKTLAHLLQRHGGHVVAEEYGAAVAWRVWLPVAAGDGFVADVIAATAGGIRPRPCEA
jgi:uncharacterized YigZ family protein